MPEYYLPAPSVVLRVLVERFGQIAPHLGVTLTEAILGFVVGNLAAIGFALAFSEIRVVRESLYPLVVGLQAVPVVAVAPFVTVWFGPGLAGKAFLAGLICYFPAVVVATDSFARVDRESFMFLRSLGATRWEIFRHLRLPSAVPGVFSALRISITLCTVGAVVAELSGAGRGVGYLIVRASYEFNTPLLFAVLLATSSATFLLFRFVERIGDRYSARFGFTHTNAQA
ncbi:MAG: ABC transporter permease [Myxococcota bacterium]